MRIQHHTIRKLINKVSEIICAITIAHILGSTNLGKLALIQTLISFANPLYTLGTKSNLMKELAGPNPENWVKATQSLTIITSILSWGGLLLLNKPGLTNLWFALACFALAIENIGASSLLIIENLEKKLQRDNAISLGASLLKISIATITKDPTLIISGIFATTILAALTTRISNSILVKTKKSEDSFQNTFEKIKTLTKGGTILALINGISNIAIQGGRLLINFYLGAASFGCYTAAQNCSLPFTFATGILYEQYMQKRIPSNPWKYAAIAALCTLTITPTIPLIYGSNFHDAIKWSLWSILPNALQGVTTYNNTILVMNGKIKDNISSTFFFTSIALATTLILMPKLGIPGLSIGLTLGNITQLLIQKEQLKKLNP